MVTDSQQRALRKSRVKAMLLSRGRGWAWSVNDVMKRNSINYNIASRLMRELLKEGYAYQVHRGYKTFYIINPLYKKVA